MLASKIHISIVVCRDALVITAGNLSHLFVLRFSKRECAASLYLQIQTYFIAPVSPCEIPYQPRVLYSAAF